MSGGSSAPPRGLHEHGIPGPGQSQPPSIPHGRVGCDSHTQPAPRQIGHSLSFVEAGGIEPRAPLRFNVFFCFVDGVSSAVLLRAGARTCVPRPRPMHRAAGCGAQNCLPQEADFSVARHDVELRAAGSSIGDTSGPPVNLCCCDSLSFYSDVVPRKLPMLSPQRGLTRFLNPPPGTEPRFSFTGQSV
jgi:hypothetical protein